MNNRKATKRALLTSVMALAMCVVMLIGTTFAWFTDTATANVNTIKSGTLDVAIMDKEGTNPVSTLEWVAHDGRPQNQILWEPGCTYTLTPFRIVNVGNLALKYKIVVTGLDGDAELLDVIKFTYKIGNDVLDLNAEGNLLAGAKSEVITISAEMDKNAGNDYMDKTLENVKITVYATQYTSEFDSDDNQYDKDATYYPVLNAAGLKDALVNGGNIQLDADVTADATMVAKKDATIDMNGKTINNTDDIWDDNNNSWGLVSARDTAELTITGDGTFQAKENDCYAVDVQDVGAKVIIENGKFVGNISAVYVYEGTAIIEGGFFSVQQKYPQAGKENEFVLNCYDANRAAGTAKIIVKGGTFVNFNPADCWAEGAGTNFVDDGYSVVSETQPNGDIWYTVVKGSGKVVTGSDDMNNAIKNAATKDFTVVIPAGQSVALKNDVANTNDPAKGKNITFAGDGSQTVDVITEAISAEGGQLSYQRGSTFTFKNVTVQAGEGSFDGIVCDELVYENCTIKGKLTLYGKATFINCTFDNTMANQYSIWTWGGTDVKFENCTFNTNGKAILLYGQATAAKPTNLTVTNCVFNDRNNGAAGKAAIEIGNDYNATYTLTMNDITVNGFAAGKNTDSTLWANKNSMDATHLTVTIDGVKAY